tara:strand:- start:610 stop:843 length:234 start_codon:yes stop_codon:yes gene_type:complete
MTMMTRRIEALHTCWTLGDMAAWPGRAATLLFPILAYASVNVGAKCTVFRTVGTLVINIFASAGPTAIRVFAFTVRI